MRLVELGESGNADITARPVVARQQADSAAERIDQANGMVAGIAYSNHAVSQYRDAAELGSEIGNRG